MVNPNVDTETKSGQVEKTIRKDKKYRFGSVAGMALGLVSMVGLSMKFDYDLINHPYRSSETFRQYSDMRTTLMLLEQKRSEFEEELFLPYKPASIKNDLSEVFGNSNPKISYLEHAITTVNSDMEQIEESDEYKNYFNTIESTRNKIIASTSGGGILMLIAFGIFLFRKPPVFQKLNNL